MTRRLWGLGMACVGLMGILADGCGMARPTTSDAAKSVPAGVPRSRHQETKPLGPSSIPSVTGSLTAMQWVSPTRGYLVTSLHSGGSSRIYETMNRGRTWQEIWATPRTTAAIRLMSWRGRTGYVWAPSTEHSTTGDVVMWSTDNGGKTWHPVPLPESLQSVWSAGPDRLVAYTVRDTWTVSLDAGEHWSPLPHAPTPGYPSAVVFATAHTAYWLSSTSRGGVWETTTGGRHWERLVATTASQVPTALAMLGPRSIWFTTAPTSFGTRSTIQVSTHSGWRTVVVPTYPPKPASGGLGASDGLSRYNNQTALAAVGQEQNSGASPEVMETHDGGNTWSVVALPPLPKRLNPATVNPLVTSAQQINAHTLAILMGVPNFGGAQATVLEYSRNDGKSWIPVAVSR